MGSGLIVVTGIGLVASIILLALSIRAGRIDPVHRMLWIIAIVVLSLTVAYRMLLIVGTMANVSFLAGLPIFVGNFAVVGTIVAAFWRPAWTGWTLIGSAIALPLITLLLAALLGPSILPLETAPVVAGFYGIPAVVSGVLLVVSGRHRASHKPAHIGMSGTADRFTG